MEKHHAVRGEELVRDVQDDYHALLRALGDKAAVREASHQQPPTKLENEVQTVLNRMKSNIAYLRINYNLCCNDLAGLPETAFQVPLLKDSKGDDMDIGQSTFTGSSTEKERLTQILQERNAQLKEIIDELRKMLWYSDTLSCSED